MSTRTPDLLRGKRVTVVLNWAFLGGAERRALEIARRLKDERGAEVDVLALTERDGRAVELARTLGIPWGGLEIAWDGRTAAKSRPSSTRSGSDVPTSSCRTAPFRTCSAA